MELGRKGYNVRTQAIGGHHNGDCLSLGSSSNNHCDRELKRNRMSTHYLPDTAARLALERRKRVGRLDQDAALRDFVLDHLCSFQWSPEQIPAPLKHKQTTWKTLSHESLYPWMDRRPRGKLWRHLARHKAKRGLRKYRKAGVSCIPERVSIHNRHKCTGFGHWEGDLMSHILVCHEKKPHFTLICSLKNKTAKQTAETGIHLLKKTPKAARKSMTLDHGGEFAKHTHWPQKLGIQTSFCDPYASWQKGAVENTNGRLRRDLPRKTNLFALSQEDFDQIILTCNSKPSVIPWLENSSRGFP